MNDPETLAAQNGFSHWAQLNMAAAVPLEAVRDMCASGRCGRYGHNWACPPGCGSIEAAARRIAGFADFARQMRRLCPGCLPLTAGSCTLCARCTYPDRPCRYPTKRLSSMEAYGLFVSDICTRSGLAYNYGPRTMTYTSCVLYNKE